MEIEGIGVLKSDLDGAATSRKTARSVIPAKAGIQVFSNGYAKSFLRA